MKVTVAICTWNRARLLDQTLTRLAEMTIPEGVTWEVIVVNNNSPDDTDEVLERHRDRLPLVRLFEPLQGKSHACNLAIRTSQGELVLWTDDDVLVATDWLTRYVQAAANFPNAAYFGGPVEPWYECEPPRWLKRNLEQFGKVVALVDYGPVDRELGLGELAIGANMAFRGDVLRKYAYDVRLCRVGPELAGCEDHELTDRMRSDGRFGMWVADARVRHFIPKERTTLRFARQWWREQARLFARRRPEEIPQGPRVPRWMWRQYWEASARELVLRTRRGSQWADAFFAAAWLRGLIDMSGPNSPHAAAEASTSGVPIATPTPAVDIPREPAGAPGG